MTSRNRARLFLLIAGPVLFLLVSEGALRLLGLPRAGSDPNFEEMVRRVDADEFYFDVDPELFWKLRPDLDVEGQSTTFRTNSLGLRGRDVEVVTDETLRRPCRVLLLGDSVTFGFGVSDDETFGSRIERSLNDKPIGCKVEVVNAGIPGYSTYQGKLLLPRLMKEIEPDMVVLCFGYNDARAVHLGDERIAEMGNRLMGVRRVLFKSNLYRLLRSVLIDQDSAEQSAPTLARVPPDQYSDNLQEMIRVVRSGDALPVLFETPFEKDTLHPYGPDEFTLALNIGVYREKAREVARLANIPYQEVEVLTELHSPGNADLFLDPIHPNAAGHGIMADLLLPLVRIQLERGK